METMETTQIGSNKKKKIETNALKNGGKKESNKWSENRAIEKMLLRKWREEVRSTVEQNTHTNTTMAKQSEERYARRHHETTYIVWMWIGQHISCDRTRIQRIKHVCCMKLKAKHWRKRKERMEKEVEGARVRSHTGSHQLAPCVYIYRVPVCLNVVVVCTQCLRLLFLLSTVIRLIRLPGLLIRCALKCDRLTVSIPVRLRLRLPIALRHDHFDSLCWA